LKTKRSAKILSLILALVMAFSLLPVSAMAEGLGKIDVGGKELGARDELEPVEEVGDIDQPVSPAVELTRTVGDLTVSVSAPRGALPNGTDMAVSLVPVEAVQAAVDNDENLNGFVLAAADITFYKNGEEVQPSGDVTVTMTSAELAGMENLSVIHLDASAEELEAGTVVEPVDGFTVDGNSVVFDADKFSVYAVVDGPTETYRYTFKFVDGAGNPYYFKDKADQLVDFQIVKNGEKLQEVPMPGLYNNNAFNGWYYLNDDGTYGDMVDFDQAFTVTENKEITIKAHYGSVIYVTFWQYAAGKVVLERKQLAVNESTGKASMNMTDVTVPAPKTTLKFMGWSLTPGSDASEENGDTPNSRPLLNNGVVEFTEDTDVYPVYYTGVWVVFVSAGTGMGAKYVESFFLPADSATAAAAEPEDPTMTGYAFDGWYTVPDEDYTAADTDTANKFNFNTSFANLADYVNDRGEVVLYGHWKGGNTTYVVVYWKQSVSDSKTATGDAIKYDYAGQTTPISATTGSAPTPTTAQQKADVGFNYNTYKLVDSKGDPITGIAPDGSSILNVYFTRKLITMRFYKTAGSYSTYNYRYTPPVAYNSGNWTNSSYADTYTGLYGQTWAQAGYTHDWPSPGTGYVWRYYNDSYTGGTSAQSGGVYEGISLLGQFKLDLPTYDTTKEEIRIFKVARSNLEDVRFYLQNTNGTSYPTTATATAVGVNGATFSFTDKYEGFKVVGYRLNSSASGTYTTVNSTTNADGTHTYTPASVTLNNTLHIRYEREKYQVKYLNPLNEAEVLTAQTLPYGASLSGAKPADTANVDLGEPGWEWDGKWYKDRNCTVEFKFDEETMPLNGTKVYAGKTPIYFYIKIDPNGGQLQTNQATWRWVLYGQDDTYTYDNIERNFIDYKGSGDAYFYYYDEFETARREDIWNYAYMASNPRTAYYTKNTVPDDWVDGRGNPHSGSEAQQWLNTTKKYSYEADAYALIGWYDITDGVENMKPFKTGTAITRDTIIQAQWRRTGEYSVHYSVEAVDASGNPLNYPEDHDLAGQRVTGANSPSDTAKYADQSDSAIMDKMGVVPAGYNFVGWWYNGKMYDPGDVFQVLASLSDDNKTVHIYPVLEPVATTPINVIDLTYYPNDGQFTDDAEEEINDLIDALKTRGGDSSTYNPTLVKNEDGSYTIKDLQINEALQILSGSTVERGIELADGTKVWGRGYRLTGWNTQPDGSGTAFTLGAEIGVDEKELASNGIPNSLYAQWEEVFYICHSGVEAAAGTNAEGDTAAAAQFETVPVAGFSVENRFKVTTGYDTENSAYTSFYYGGYALYAAHDAAADGLTFKAGDVATGSVADSYWTRAKAARSATPWTTELQAGTVIYVKEVPTTYLASPKYITINEEYGAGEISNLSLLSVTDTSIYRKGGVKVGSDTVYGIFTKTYTLSQHGSDYTHTFDATELFPGMSADDYLTVSDATSFVEAGAKLTVRPFWLTVDNVTVESLQSRELSISSDLKEIS